MKNQKEIWKDIDGYEGLYQVSKLGRVKSLARIDSLRRCVKERILKPGLSSSRYLSVVLFGYQKKAYLVHQLVAIAFLDHKPCGHKLVVDHKDFDRTNNKLSNLRLITVRENTNQKHVKSTSEYVGVSRCKTTKKWNAFIFINGKNKNLGSFMDELDASNAYKNKLIEL